MKTILTFQMSHHDIQTSMIEGHRELTFSKEKKNKMKKFWRTNSIVREHFIKAGISVAAMKPC